MNEVTQQRQMEVRAGCAIRAATACSILVSTILLSCCADTQACDAGFPRDGPVLEARRRLTDAVSDKQEALLFVWCDRAA